MCNHFENMEWHMRGSRELIARFWYCNYFRNLNQSFQFLRNDGERLYLFETDGNRITKQHAEKKYFSKANLNSTFQWNFLHESFRIPQTKKFLPSHKQSNVIRMFKTRLTILVLIPLLSFAKTSLNCCCYWCE